MESSVRSSRARLCSILFAVAAVHAVVLLTSEIEGPGSAQLRVEAAAAGALIGPGPEQVVLVALVAAMAFGCAALVFGARIALAPRLASPAGAAGAADPARRRLLLSAGGGAAALAVAWAYRGRPGPLDDQRVGVALSQPAASLSGPAPATGSSAAGPAVGGPAGVSPGGAVAPAVPSAPTAPAAAPIAPAAPTAVPTAPAVPTAVPTAPAVPTAAPTVVSPPASASAVAPAAAEEYPPEPAAVGAAPPAAKPPAPAALASAPAPTAAARLPAPVAAALKVTRTMPGGRNNYVAGAPLVPNLGEGFVVSGTVLDAATGGPVRNTRIQIWLNTARGGERLASNRGSVLTDEQGRYRLETSPVVPQFGQPHVHIAYDDGEYDTLFLRPVLKSEKDPSIAVDFVLGTGAA
jgi:hypothetical protein